MNRLILTSSGFNNKNIARIFIDSINLPVDEIKVLFIPTAALSQEQKEIVTLCKNEILELGIKEENITSYDLDRKISLKDIIKYNAIYICGGTTQHLLNKMNEVNFSLPLRGFIERNGVVLGVSAGSIVFAKNLQDNLGYVNCILKVHQKTGSKCGKLDLSNCPTITLTDNQALLVSDAGFEIVE